MGSSNVVKKEPAYLRFATDKERKLLFIKDDRPLMKKAQAVIKSMIRTRNKMARLSVIVITNGSMKGRLSKKAEKLMMELAEKYKKTEK